jgi:hypothetical protein
MNFRNSRTFGNLYTTMEIQLSSEYQLTGKVLSVFKLAYGLIDYPTIVKTPMDLGTVQTKLNNG